MTYGVIVIKFTVITVTSAGISSLLILSILILTDSCKNKQFFDSESTYRALISQLLPQGQNVAGNTELRWSVWLPTKTGCHRNNLHAIQISSTSNWGGLCVRLTVMGQLSVYSSLYFIKYLFSLLLNSLPFKIWRRNVVVQIMDIIKYLFSKFSIIFPLLLARFRT